MRKFAVFDIDGTLIRWQLYHAIADELVKQGAISSEEYAHVKEARMAWKQRSSEDAYAKYERALIKIFDDMLMAITVDDFSAAVEHVFQTYKDQAYAYTRDLIKQLKKDSYFLLAISGSPEAIVEKVASYYGFDAWVGSQYETNGNQFTGKKFVAAHDKSTLLKKLMTDHSLGRAGSIGVGDSEGDISMLELVETPIVMNPTRKLADYAKQKGWKIIIERKNIVYRLEEHNGRYQLAEAD